MNGTPPKTLELGPRTKPRIKDSKRETQGLGPGTQNMESRMEDPGGRSQNSVPEIRGKSFGFILHIV